MKKEQLRELVNKYHMNPIRENILDDSSVCGFYVDSETIIPELEELEKNNDLHDNYCIIGWWEPCWIDEGHGAYRYKIIMDHTNYDLRDLIE
ncbi:MAG: hypothetical protein ACI4SJ_07305 [Candidatus Avispirillum sp.]